MQEQLLGLAGAGLQLVLAAAAALSPGICQERCSEETKSNLKRLSEALRRAVEDGETFWG